MPPPRVQSLVRELRSRSCAVWPKINEWRHHPNRSSSGASLGRWVGAGMTVVLTVQSCPIPSESVDRSTPGFPVHHQLPELAQTHVHRVSDAIQPSHPLVIPFSSRLPSFPASVSFPMSRLFPSGGQRTGVSASASVLPMKIQGWSPLGWTGWISLQSTGLSGVFSSTTFQKHQFICAQPSLQSSPHVCTWLLGKPLMGQLHFGKHPHAHGVGIPFDRWRLSPQPSG